MVSITQVVQMFMKEAGIRNFGENFLPKSKSECEQKWVGVMKPPRWASSPLILLFDVTKFCYSN